METADAMLDAVEGQTWDIIISDYKMPHFNGLEALKLYKEKGDELEVFALNMLGGSVPLPETKVLHSSGNCRRKSGMEPERNIKRA